MWVDGRRCHESVEGGATDARRPRRPRRGPPLGFAADAALGADARVGRRRAVDGRAAAVERGAGGRPAGAAAAVRPRLARLGWRPAWSEAPKSTVSIFQQTRERVFPDAGARHNTQRVLAAHAPPRPLPAPHPRYTGLVRVAATRTHTHTKRTTTHSLHLRSFELRSLTCWWPDGWCYVYRTASAGPMSRPAARRDVFTATDGGGRVPP